MRHPNQLTFNNLFRANMLIHMPFAAFQCICIHFASICICIYLHQIDITISMKITVSRAALLKEEKAGKCHKDGQEGCSCEMMDMSLSRVSDSDCTCSDCLEANLEAFNQIETTQFVEPPRKNSVGRATVKSNRLKQNGLKLNQGASLSQNHSNVRNIQTISFNRTKAQIAEKSPCHEVEIPPQNESQQGLVEKWDIEQFILITRNRTRKYIEERRKLEGGESCMKQQLKIKIKQNLENLKYSTALLKRKDGNDQPLNHPYKWNHKPSQNCMRQREQKREPHLISKLNTNLQAIIPDFEVKRQNILEQLKSERIAKIKKQSTAKCLDLCDSHPTKSDPNKMKKIEAMIRKNVQKLKERNRVRRLKNEEVKKVKQAKLRAIDLKCKQLVGRAKKYDSDLRSSFHASADHFSTFSELREANNVRKSQKQLRKRAETELDKQVAERAIFENLQGEDQEPRIEAQRPTEIGTENKGIPIQHEGKRSMADMHSKDTRNSVQKKSGKLQSIKEVNKRAKLKPDLRQIARSATRIETLGQKEGAAHRDTFNEFVKDALIKAPKKIKQEDKTEDKKRESKKKFNAKEEEAKNKKLSRQIEKKKQQIVSQYKKQNAVAQNIESRNKKLREQYESKLAAKKVVPEIVQQVKQPRDLYSSKYEIQPEGDVQKMMIHGDPLMHEHERKTKINKAKKAGEKSTDDIFTADLKTLLGRAQLKF